MNKSTLAFPKPPRDEFDFSEYGMTLREYYAGLAMQGLLSNDGEIGYESCAIVAVKYADALIAELEESNDA